MTQIFQFVMISKFVFVLAGSERTWGDGG